MEATKPKYYMVIARRGDEVVRGYAYYEYPVDVPPIVKLDGRALYIDVWKRRGWEVEWV